MNSQKMMVTNSKSRNNTNWDFILHESDNLKITFPGT